MLGPQAAQCRGRCSASSAVALVGRSSLKVHAKARRRYSATRASCGASCICSRTSPDYVGRNSQACSHRISISQFNHRSWSSTRLVQSIGSAILPLHPELVSFLSEWLPQLGSHRLSLPKARAQRTWFMVKRDLESVQIPHETDDGFADFHAAGLIRISRDYSRAAHR
jgi:hypothetical protein